MAFFRRKKAPEEAPEETPKQVPVTLSLSLHEDRGKDGLQALLAALPAGSEVAAEGGASDLPEGVFSAQDGVPRGKFTVFADAEEAFDGKRAAEFFACLADCDCDALFFGEGEESGGTEDPLGPILRGERPLPRRAALGETLSKESAASGLCRKYRELFIPLAFAGSTAGLPVSFCAEGKDKGSPYRPSPADTVALAGYFDKIKGKLSPERYRFCFRYIANEAAAAFAGAALSGETDILRAQDAALKAENMALWVSLADRPPFSFMSTLRKKNYRLPFYLKAVLKGYFAFKR